MKIFRNIDWMGQVLVGVGGLVAMAISLTLGMYIEFFLGAWQLISALINSYFIYRSVYRRHIIVYWALTAIALSMLASGNDVLMMAAIYSSWGIAIYYAVIYRCFISHLAYRAELATVVRH